LKQGSWCFRFCPAIRCCLQAGRLRLLVLIVFFAAAVIGDTVNYHIGRKVGTTIIPGSFLGRLIDQEKMKKAENFFNKHGGKTIVIARFMPLIRTFIPFVAGASRMNYRYFFIYNVAGAALWVGICTIAGYYFGNIPVIKNNFSTVIFIIIFVSVLPAVISVIKERLKKNKGLSNRPILLLGTFFHSGKVGLSKNGSGLFFS
jgi:membrane-associated protein